nr:MAG TPA: hypothetical protein [Crassvirales sp.]
MELELHPPLFHRPPREQRQHILRQHCIAIFASTNAPVWGATLSGVYYHHQNSVSIHAPARGATTAGSEKFDAAMFQSTHPHGVRLS